jgi:hypothetical protein
VLAIPGNHDWYDGLAGFMYHFCHRDELTPAAYTPVGAGLRSIIARPFRILWRRPPKPALLTRTHWEAGWKGSANTLTGPIAQPGPYYAIRTRHVTLVAIDTGIDGSIDAVQGAWLRAVSEVEGPKILVTGKPLLVNGTRHPCRIGPAVGDAPQGSVWDIVHADNGYLATIGGDVHNFQHYVKTDVVGGPTHHIVCGSGGAYMHATHTYAFADLDSRIRNNTDHPFDSMPQSEFPDQYTSFRYYAGLLVPGLARMLRNALLFLLGVLIAGGAALAGTAAGLGTAGARSTGWAALVGIGTLIVVRSIGRDVPRTSKLARGVVAVGAFMAGALASAVAYQLDPERYLTYLTAWLSLTLAHCVFCAAIRRSGWWCPADEHAQVLPLVGFAFGLLGLCGVTAILLWAVYPASSGLLPTVGAALVAVVGVAGAVARRRRFTRPGVTVAEADKPRLGRANSRWYKIAAVAVPLVQALIFVIGLYQLGHRVERPWIFTGGVLGVGVCLLILIGSLVGVVLVTEVAAFLGSGGAGGYRRAWGAAAVVTHHLMAPLMLAGVATWIVLASVVGPGRGARAAGGLPFVVYPVIGYLLFVAWLRQRQPRSYLYAVLLIVFVAIVGLVIAYRFDVWFVRSGLATAIVMFALTISVLIGHLTFLGAQFLIGPASYRDVSFTEAEIDEIFAARRSRPPQVPDVPRRVLRWARLAAPGLGETGGPIQKGVSEIFSSDVPPFFKGFLRLDTTDDALTITLHQVFGDRPATSVPVATIPLA